MKAFFFIIIGLFLISTSSLLGACLPQANLTPAPLPTGTPVPIPTLAGTPTIVWFPPTPTFTPYPTQVVTPTVEMRTGIGAVLLEDKFTSSLDWSLPSTAEGTAAINGGALSIAIPDSRAYIYALRLKPALDDFYVEITAMPALCAGLDEYGLLTRFSSPSDYYRLGLSCDGQVHLERVSAGKSSPLQGWMISGAFPPGAPGDTRIGLWAKGDELRVFINGIYQFSVHDSLNKSGSIAVYARSTGADALTVLFSNLVINQLNR